MGIFSFDIHLTLRESANGTPETINKGHRCVYGLSFLEEKEKRIQLLKLRSVKNRLPNRLFRNKSTSNLVADNVDDGSNNPSSGSSESPDDTGSEIDEDAWMYHDYGYENLAMSGGGAKGYAYIGCLKALEDSGSLQGIKRIVGTSAGAVIGGMLAVGFTSQEVANFFKCNVKKLFQDKNNAAMCLFLPKLFTKFGMNSGQRFYDIYGAFLATRTNNPDITFEEAYQTYGKELCVTVTNLSRMCSEYCHHTTTPDLPIRTAVKISMAFPGMYESMKTDLFGHGTYVYVDGGTLENFPVQYFDDINPETQEPIYNPKTVGLYLISEDQFSHKVWGETFRSTMDPFPTYLPDTKLAKERVKCEIKRRKKKNRGFDGNKYMEELNEDPYYADGKPHMRHYSYDNKEQIDIKGPKNYFKAMLSTLLLSQKHNLVKPTDLKRTIGINCGYIDTKDTTIEPGDREFLIRQGYEQTRAFLQHFTKESRLKPCDRKLKRPQSLPNGLQYGSWLSVINKTRMSLLLQSPTEHDEDLVFGPSSQPGDSGVESSEHTPTNSIASTGEIDRSLPAFSLSYEESSPVVTRSKIPETKATTINRNQSDRTSRPESMIDLSETIFTKL